MDRQDLKRWAFDKLEVIDQLLARTSTRAPGITDKQNMILE